MKLTKETLVCDVSGQTRDVQTVQVQISVGGTPLLEPLVADLSPKAQDRLVKFITRGMKPPTPKKESAAT